MADEQSNNEVLKSTTEKNVDPLIIEQVNVENSDTSSEKDYTSRFNIQNIDGFVEVVSAEPTHIPKTFWDSMKIYSGLLYYYDYKNHVWKKNIQQFAQGVREVSTTGTVTITVGFRPKVIKITAMPAGNHNTQSFGTYNTADSTHYCLFRNTTVGGNLQSI